MNLTTFKLHTQKLNTFIKHLYISFSTHTYGFEQTNRQSGTPDNVNAINDLQNSLSTNNNNLEESLIIPTTSESVINNSILPNNIKSDALSTTTVKESIPQTYNVNLIISPSENYKNSLKKLEQDASLSIYPIFEKSLKNSYFEGYFYTWLTGYTETNSKFICNKNSGFIQFKDEINTEILLFLYKHFGGVLKKTSNNVMIYKIKEKENIKHFLNSINIKFLNDKLRKNAKTIATLYNFELDLDNTLKESHYNSLNSMWFASLFENKNGTIKLFITKKGKPKLYFKLKGLTEQMVDMFIKHVGGIKKQNRNTFTWLLEWSDNQQIAATLIGIFHNKVLDSTNLTAKCYYMFFIFHINKHKIYLDKTHPLYPIWSNILQNWDKDLANHFEESNNNELIIFQSYFMALDFLQQSFKDPDTIREEKDKELIANVIDTINDNIP
eukprot:TRINITY_DN3759_c0_g1_i1.p1 TRINITY_DN3759_c0_g1~~TRINITY_DN3759_c0_g1_i1.p1  ORF type:complete len:440 (-),score=-104.53 TRINITY_DN3759_c0_g1_i1:202-1521(-)